MNEQRRIAAATFVTMELHVADCWRCRHAEIAYDAAKRSPLACDPTWAQRQLGEIARQFCPEMQQLARRFSEQAKAAYGLRWRL